MSESEDACQCLFGGIERCRSSPETGFSEAQIHEPARDANHRDTPDVVDSIQYSFADVGK
jgi:hypothetical protein